jgi:2-amino-4-hydroxy-6-hydroxymethyldihydropteridine diphosphokinase
MIQAYIGFGANLANPRKMLLRVVETLAEQGLIIEDVSPLYRSPAWPAGNSAPDYLNAVLSVRFVGNPNDLMTVLLGVERALGRRRSTPNAPRVVDLDLLDVPGVTQNTDHLTLPHPRLDDRAFVLLPLRDVAPGWEHANGQTISQLIQRADCSQTHRV